MVYRISIITNLSPFSPVMKSSRLWPWPRARTLYEVLGLGLGLGLGRQVLGLDLGLGPQVLDNWLPHNNFTFCNFSLKYRIRELKQKNVCIYIVTYLDQVQVLI